MNVYRCGLCSDLSKPGQTMMKHAVKRPDGSIQREIPLCKYCNAQIQYGRPLSQVADFAKRRRQQIEAEKEERRKDKLRRRAVRRGLRKPVLSGNGSSVVVNTMPELAVADEPKKPKRKRKQPPNVGPPSSSPIQM